MPIELLVTINETYIPPLKTLLNSIHQTESQPIHVWLIHRQIDPTQLKTLSDWITGHNMTFTACQAIPAVFGNAPITAQYPVETYFRLLSGQILPKTLHRVLYIDPDILAQGPLDELWQLDMQGRPFAAAAHQDQQLENRQRMQINHAYYNTGVLLIDLDRVRQLINFRDITAYITTHEDLPLVDQDILNGLYGNQVTPIDDKIWNFDVPSYANYLEGGLTPEWIAAHTRLLHYQRQPKPWQPEYAGPLGKNYQQAQISE
ncbi:glycosyltransferase family 8 protein [Secundilactobacillus paracollinoides]|uniref:Glycosyl transferase n=1 Tax=Secundilactobacillus paracollinoides TaxID=240427 RepID=A0A1B2IXH1_9LACO|nr:glycosyltransferase family 8 protein [Secundilactobacillus paracollinoides]ANZ66732.1 hypothetical protein AYR63_06020 [Secundilactobacillus paracollinoides]